MQQDQKQQKEPQPQAVKKPARPNEQGAISVTGFVKIFDPKTKETFVETRT
jgi:hypothetical protein